MSALDGIRARAEAAARIPHHRTGPGKCACGFDAYKVGYYVYDYGEERQRHEDAARRAAKKQDTDTLRLLAAIDAALALAVRLDASPQCEDREIADDIRAAVNNALEGPK